MVTGKDTKGALSIMQSPGFNNIDEADAMELYYVMGPGSFSTIMVMMLQMGLKNEDDIKTFISNAIIRHELLVALNLPPKY